MPLMVTPTRRDVITAAIDTEVARQGQASIDVDALAAAIDAALATHLPDGEPTSEDGKRPDELNAANDV